MQIKSRIKPGHVKRMSLLAVTGSAFPWSCSAIGLMTVEMARMSRTAKSVSWAGKILIVAENKQLPDILFCARPLEQYRTRFNVMNNTELSLT